MFVLPSDFDVPPFSLPDLGSNNSFGDYVEEHEKGILKKLLGKTFYDSVVAGLAAAGSGWSATVTYGLGAAVSLGNNVWTSLQAANINHAVENGAWWTLTEVNNKWLLLKNGATYTYSGIEYEWYGMTKMLVSYVYSQWLKDTFDAHTGNGIVMPETENGIVLNPGRRICAAYNKFSDMAGYGVGIFENSLFGYLYANEVLYPDAWKYFSPRGRMNVFDL